MNRSCLAFFRNQVVFFVFLFWTCKLNILRYTEDNIFALVCLTLKYLTELKVYFPDLKDQNEIVASDEHLCLCDRNVTCCFNSCTLFFYQTLGLSFCADHKCCPFLFLRQVFEKKSLISTKSEHSSQINVNRTILFTCLRCDIAFYCCSYIWA